MAAVADEQYVRIEFDSDLVIARSRGRELGMQLGFSRLDLTLIATAISELGRNILQYAQRGEIALVQINEFGRPGIAIIARDNGPGIINIERAMQDGYTTGRGLGMGLPGTKRLMDDFQIVSALGKGTTITAKKWVRL